MKFYGRIDNIKGLRFKTDAHLKGYCKWCLYRKPYRQDLK
jgi:hypothetical protein